MTHTMLIVILNHLHSIGAHGLCREGCSCTAYDFAHCRSSALLECTPAVSRICRGCGDHVMLPLDRADEDAWCEICRPEE